jgi:ubiquinone/menaquinone biosynthesis C-methylase UbiE
VIGVDPDFEWAREARRRTDIQTVGLSIATGERLPFPAGSFDGIFSNLVVEHAADLNALLAEMMRVCTPGGWCYINGPNYLLPYGPHYRMLLLPWLPRRLAEWWLKRYGRDPSYLHCCIRYIDPLAVIRELRQLGATSEINLIQRSIAEPKLFASERMRKLARWVNWLPWPSWLVYLLSPSFSILVWKSKVQ